MKSMAKLKYYYGLKMRCYPSDQQKQLIKLNSDASRFIYNEMIAINQELFQLRQVKIPVVIVQERIRQLELRKKAKEMSNHYQFLEDRRIDSLAKANAIQNYRKAWNTFSKVHTAGVPKFHRKGYRWSYQTNCQYPGQKFALMTNGTIRFTDMKHVKVPKIGQLRVSGSQQRLLNRHMEIRIGTVTLTKDTANRFFLSMQLASDQPFVKFSKPKGGPIGIDLNTENFLTDSQGESIPHPRYYRIIQGRLAKAQRTLSRRQLRAKKELRSLKGSRNYQKQRLLVAKLHAKAMDQRHNFLQQHSTTLIKNHDLVVAEELRSKNMLKNHALALSISDVGWRSFLNMLAYKADLYERKFITVNPRNTTQMCHKCGFIMGTNGTSKLTLKDRVWTCPNCGFKHVRDENAAKNILDRGLAKLA